MAILSASRRTDIPTYYGEWFVNRLKEGFFMTRNPYNNKLSKTLFRKEDIDCIVFWTKNPIPFIKYLPDIKDYPYYFQFTVTGYGRDMEENVPDTERAVRAFKELHDNGNGHIIWRYDPIVFTDKYTPEWHIEAFRRFAEALRPYTDRCVISFVDGYAHIAKGMVSPLNSGIDLKTFCKELASTAKKNDIDMYTCAEVVDLAACGIKKGKCIDGDYIQEITGKVIGIGKDKGQREACGCIESVEVGAYNTCQNGCKYCYACTDKQKTENCMKRYDPKSPVLCDTIHEDETYSEKKLKSFARDPEPEQLALF